MVAAIQRSSCVEEGWWGNAEYGDGGGGGSVKEGDRGGGSMGEVGVREGGGGVAQRIWEQAYRFDL